ncbi:MAG: hypothetical protein P8Y84_04420, partial [Desulfuromonadales bacterium]
FLSLKRSLVRNECPNDTADEGSKSTDRGADTAGEGGGVVAVRPSAELLLPRRGRPARPAEIKADLEHSAGSGGVIA